MPAACGCCSRNAAAGSRAADDRNGFPLRGVMAVSLVRNVGVKPGPRARERVVRSSLPNGNTGTAWGRAPRRVERRQRGCRETPGTKLNGGQGSTKARPATSTRDPLRTRVATPWAGDPGPKYRDEVTTPGRQGNRASREFNPACGSATSIGTTPTAFALL